MTRARRPFGLMRLLPHLFLELAPDYVAQDDVASEAVSYEHAPCYVTNLAVPTEVASEEKGDAMRTLSVGKANVSVINVGDFMWDLTEKMHIPESAWRPRYAACFERPQLFPTQGIHIALPGASILVDPCYHDLAPGFLSLMPDYQQPPRLMAQLAEKGVQPEAITHVVITHAHFDHYADVTKEQEGHVLPCFPHAHCFLGRADWEDRSVQEALQDPSSNESRTLGVLHQYRLLELVEGNRDLVPGVRMIATPGETPGHYIVRVHS